MKYRVRLTLLAEVDIDHALNWFASQSAIVAGQRWFAQLMAKIATLESEPLRCPLASESVDVKQEIRQLLFGRRNNKYRILFVVEGQTVQILRVWHGARDAITGADL